MFRIGDRYRIGPLFSNGDIANMAAGTTRETIFVVSTVSEDSLRASFIRESDSASFWPSLPNYMWIYNDSWFIPVPEEFLLVQVDEDGLIEHWVNSAGRYRMTLEQARAIVQQDHEESQELHLIPLRSTFKFSVDEDGDITETDYSNIQQGA